MITIAPIGPQPVTRTDRPSSGTGAVYRVQRHRQRLGHRALAVGDVLCQPMRLAHVDHDLLPECTLYVGHAHGAAVVAHVEAVVLQSHLAEAADTARAAGADGKVIADGEAGDVGRNFFDDTCHLVAQHHGLLETDGAESAVLVVVQVRAADAAGAHAHADLSRPDRRRRNVFNAKVTGTMDDECVHSACLESESVRQSAPVSVGHQSTDSQPPST
jgi:hypothetical protein